jgi:hypothetical protein
LPPEDQERALSTVLLASYIAGLDADNGDGTKGFDNDEGGNVVKARGEGETRKLIETRRPDVYHPMVRRHPQTGRPSIFLGDRASIGRTLWIAGDKSEEGRAFLHRMYEFATQERFVYRHHWKPGEVVIWDNRRTLHRAYEFDYGSYRRVLWHIGTIGERPVPYRAGLLKKYDATPVPLGDMFPDEAAREQQRTASL